MMNDPQARAKMARRAVQTACLGIALLLGQAGTAWARGGFQHSGGGGRPAPHAAPHGQAPRGQAPHSQARPQAARPMQPNRPQPNGPQGAPGAGRFQENRPPANYAQPNRLQQVPGGRPAYNSAPYSMRATPQPGHLPQWLAQHQNMPVGQQERLLRGEPGFNRLSPGDQQREIQQLHHLNELPEAQRQRRTARNEAIERLSPNERMQINQSFRQMSAMPPDRQAIMKHAFRDLRGVPVDQRDMVLNSARYSSTFTPQERGILSNLLSVEPYEAPR